MLKSWVGVVVMGVALAVGNMALGQDKKIAEPAPRGRGSLPPQWSKLGLTDQQKEQAYAIVSEIRGKIDDLQKQIRKLRREETARLEKILTDSQRARLREIMSERMPGGGPKEEAQPPKDRSGPGGQ